MANSGPARQDLTAVYAGSFDPITNGHVDIIERTLQVFERVIVAVAFNPNKDSALFTPEERVDLVMRTTSRFGNVEVRQFAGLAVKFVRECGAHVMIRGVRPLTDIEFEMTMVMANRQLDPGIETVFLMADKEFAHVSSSLIKQIAPLADDEELASFVPAEVVSAMRRKMA